jgi:hypothetical protein
MTIDLINTELQYLAQEYYDTLADMQYDEMMEAMYGSDPRWEGADWDWNEGLWYWEKK